MGLLLFCIGLAVGCVVGVLLIALASMSSTTPAGEEEGLEEIFVDPSGCKCPEYSCHFPDKRH